MQQFRAGASQLLGYGRVWTFHADGSVLQLEEASLRAIGEVRGECSAGAMRNSPDPVTLHCSISAPGAPTAKVQIGMTMSEWCALRTATDGAGVLRLMLAPTVLGRYRPQAWIDDRAHDIDDGKEEFNALPGILETYPQIEQFLAQAGRRGWDDLARYAKAAKVHSGPFEVEIDEDLVLALAALYKGNGRLVSDLLAGDPTAPARVTQEDWERLRNFVQVLSPRPTEAATAADTVESLFLESLAAWEDEEDSVKEEHADLIRRMRQMAQRLRPPAFEAAPEPGAGCPRQRG